MFSGRAVSNEYFKDYHSCGNGLINIGLEYEKLLRKRVKNVKELLRS